MGTAGLGRKEKEKTKAVVKEEEMPQWIQRQTFGSWKYDYDRYKERILEKRGKTETDDLVEEEIKGNLIKMLKSSHINERLKVEIWNNVNVYEKLEKIVEKLRNRRSKDPDYLKKQKLYEERYSFK